MSEQRPSTLSRDDTAASTRARPRFSTPARSLAVGLVALLLAAGGEALARQHNPTLLSPGLYLIAIVMFTLSTRGGAACLRQPKGIAQGMLPAASEFASAGTTCAAASPNPKRRRLVTLTGAGLALALALGALIELRADLRSIAGAWLWIAGLSALVMTGIALRRNDGWPALWGADIWPRDRRSRFLLIGAVVVLLAIAAAARLVGLDKVPLGINADEGDRAATSISILRGANTNSIFDSGWYYISMMYFTLLAQFFKLAGIGFVQARTFTALFGIASVAPATLLAIRHFGWRVGLLAGFLLSLLGVSLQFARETSEAGITATCWALSLLFFLEAARRGQSWAWIGAGLAGGYSLYFYPSGRLWAFAAVAFCLYLLVHGLGARRRAILRGMALAALAALLCAGPFLVNASARPGELSRRFEQTAAFIGDNATRLAYYTPGMSAAQLWLEQCVRALGMFNQFPDGGGFWPTGLPLMPAALALLTLVGIGWCTLRWRDPRCAALAIWFWVSLSGVITTVETPNVQRLATAVPILTVFPALVLDELARRAERLGLQSAKQGLLRRLPNIAVAALVVALMISQANFYFVEYAGMERWPFPTAEGNAANSEGANAWVLSLGRDFHRINSGWIRLLAPGVERAGIQSPGLNLPLTWPATSDLAFTLYAKQSYYLPYLALLYPGGVTVPYLHRTEGLMFTYYRVTQQQWAAAQGVTVTPLSAAPVRVPALGVAPSGWNIFPAAMRWSAGLHVPRYWNYGFQAGPGPARLTIDGIEVLNVPAGATSISTTVALAHGDHALQLDGALSAEGQSIVVQWAERLTDEPMPAAAWQTLPTASLIAGQDRPVGLFGVGQVPGRPAQHRIDRTLATCCLRDELQAEGRSYMLTWTGVLSAPAAGTYAMSLFAQGDAILQIDGQTVIHTDEPAERPVTGTLSLSAGAHAVLLVYRASDTPGGLEWAWTPPDGPTSIVPYTVLSPPPGAGIEPPVPLSLLGPRDLQPADLPPVVVR